MHIRNPWFYTLFASVIERSHLPDSLTRNLPRHPIPAALLGRIAVSQQSQGSGLGGALLADALMRILAVDDHFGIYALITNAIDDPAQRFYEHFGFYQLQQSGLLMFFTL